MRSPFTRILAAALSVAIVFIVGCSKDEDTPVTPPDHTVNIKLKAGSNFSYNRWDLKMDNTKDDASKRTYNVEIRGSGGLTLGTYTDWFYWIGTDMKSFKQDTLFIRTEATNSDVMVYGFQHEILSSFVQMIQAAYPTITPPNVPSSKWDIIGKYTIPVGSTWNISDPSGVPLSFVIPGLPTPVTITVTITGKYEAKGEKMTVGTKEVLTYKSSATISLDVFGSKQNIIANFWFCDDPTSAQVKFMNTSVEVNALNLIKVPIPGEVQELTSLPTR